MLKDLPDKILKAAWLAGCAVSDEMSMEMGGITKRPPEWKSAEERWESPHVKPSMRRFSEVLLQWAQRNRWFEA